MYEYLIVLRTGNNNDYNSVAHVVSPAITVRENISRSRREAPTDYATFGPEDTAAAGSRAETARPEWVRLVVTARSRPRRAAVSTGPGRSTPPRSAYRHRGAGRTPPRAAGDPAEAICQEGVGFRTRSGPRGAHRQLRRKILRFFFFSGISSTPRPARYPAFAPGRGGTTILLLLHVRLT